ncbi:helix-turn-helix domain-containing protein [Prescottella equi]|uniref:helix-turn-helix domain-containing protein n=1 Tax=Rhodococcus hoagii TaxID=43767 RepID=UPI0019DA41C9|nr:helix-turn-helix domain-containing protein [Prescottella equi]MBM4580875.1 helix-turn-helix domain-containing protein [Prescottella equi]MBM4580890.1 helix-turn-helix domain-containing protein [Prescottella equi]MBM4580952.1 helix-turn-helix domain-containing protein [Prescottella equi]MBM4581429.1 helix-turn-helix domain-containing protein [Prescottella equi]MBM4581449.1 helix-turn-helix domain-containing protein [Prescottella equi]
MSASPWLTVREVADYSRCCTDIVYAALQAGELAGTQRVVPNGRWTIHRDAVDRWLCGERASASKTLRSA